MRTILHYLSSYFIIVLYGGQVCPFIEQLGLKEFALLMAAIYVLVLTLRYPFSRRLKKVPFTEQSGRRFILEVVTGISIGLLLSLFQNLFYSFPVSSGGKVLLATAALAIFSGIDLSLQSERFALQNLDKSRQSGAPLKESSLTRKFTLFAAISLLFTAAIISLVIIKDLSWIASLGENNWRMGIMLIVTEVLFVMGVFTSHILNLILSYSKNLRIFFQAESQVLENVARGNLDSYVPVLRRDEFGHIAEHTNEMIDELREKNKIKNIFGKMVSPEIAKRLMADSGGELKGTRQPLTILFSDIRNFTRLTETMSPEKLVKTLNTYLSAMVDIVHEQGGEIDKFMGDGILAVFGLQGDQVSAENAVCAARAMIAKVKELDLGVELEIGVGIHHGEAIAGNVGSPERLEFTVMGDVVNTAARLESLTKNIGKPIAISGRVLELLEDENKNLPWENHGPQTLKGKQQTVDVFGL